jgi:hypothetical protein
MKKHDLEDMHDKKTTISEWNWFLIEKCDKQFSFFHQAYQAYPLYHVFDRKGERGRFFCIGLNASIANLK